jgi:hypothetical protein
VLLPDDSDQAWRASAEGCDEAYRPAPEKVAKGYECARTGEGCTKCACVLRRGTSC